MTFKYTTFPGGYRIIHHTFFWQSFWPTFFAQCQILPNFTHCFTQWFYSCSSATFCHCNLMPSVIMLDVISLTSSQSSDKETGRSSVEEVCTRSYYHKPQAEVRCRAYLLRTSEWGGHLFLLQYTCCSDVCVGVVVKQNFGLFKAIHICIYFLYIFSVRVSAGLLLLSLLIS